VARLAHSDLLVLGYQLPLPQLLVAAARATAPDPLWTRMLFAALGALLAPLAARVLTPVAGTLAARCAGVFVALHPLLLYYSIVPYQESLLLLFLLTAAAAMRGLPPSHPLPALLIGLACLCRYEAWIAAALAALARRQVRHLWAPLLWILCWQGLSPRGTAVLDLALAGARLQRIGFLWEKLRDYSGDPLLLLALVGLASAWRLGALRLPALYVAGVLVAVVALGHEFPPGSGLLSERLCHLPAFGLCALAGLGVARIARCHARAGRIAAVAVVAWVGVGWLQRSRDLVEVANQAPALRLALAVAEFADVHLAPGARLAVAAPAVAPAAIEDYVRKVERAGGDAAAARATARALSGRAPDADRIAAQLARPPALVIDASAWRQGDLLAIYDDAPPGAPPVRSIWARFTAGPRAVSVGLP
jgi:hypothetical protein